MENTFATCDKYIIILKIFVLDFMIILGYELIYHTSIIYEDALQNLIIQPSL